MTIKMVDYYAKPRTNDNLLFPLWIIYNKFKLIILFLLKELSLF
ncbi:protein of unknown function [Xenorhabdus poinarii G6]|uniref:Uncharacterized protein n=1 Tax=Xenorhabdus poinarii G6 TaxID=1354304 RepID=A0A068R677_9GAMM|nr:protein of unknown function [Xenorhabdus poinarii G6]